MYTFVDSVFDFILLGILEISPETHIFSDFFNGNLTFLVLAIKGTEKGVVEPYPRDVKG